MKKTLLTLAFALPIFGFSQLFDFNSGDNGWIKVGTTAFTVGASSPTGQLLVNGAGITSNFLQTNVNSGIDANTKKFVRIKLKNNTVLATTGQLTVRLRAGSAYSSASSGYGLLGSTVNITSSDTTYKEYFINLTGVSGWTGTMYPDIRFTKPAYVAGPPEQNRWDNNNIEIDEIEFLSDLYKHDYTFDDDLVDSWAGESSGTNSSTVTASSGKLIVTPGDALKGSKASNSLYSVDATNNKYVHVIYKNNSVNRDKLRVQYFTNVGGDNYVTSKLLPLETIATNGNIGEAIFDASAVADWSGSVRKLGLILPTDLVANPGGYDLLSLEVDRIIINNSSATLSTSDISKAKNSLQVYVSENTLNFRNVNVSKATIYNMNGQLLKDAKVQNNAVDVSNLKAGVYMVKTVAHDNTETATKFIKK